MYTLLRFVRYWIASSSKRENTIQILERIPLGRKSTRVQLTKKKEVNTLKRRLGEEKWRGEPSEISAITTLLVEA
jgi:hypothetical protein